MNNNKASEAQAKYIESLIAKRGMSKEEIAMWWVSEVKPAYASLKGNQTMRQNLRSISKTEASRGIEALLDAEKEFTACDNCEDSICARAKELALNIY